MKELDQCEGWKEAIMSISNAIVMDRVFETHAIDNYGIQTLAASPRDTCTLPL